VPLAPDELGSRLRARFGDDVHELEEQFGHAVATVSSDRYHDICRFLRDEPEIACDYCDFTGGVDFGEQGFQVVTHFHSTRHHHNVRLKVKLPRDDPSVSSISDLFPTCDWHEREAAELFGIRFDGHPKPVKLLLPEPFDGHPLRKDFPLMTREAKPWPGAVEGEEEEEE
jgi:NADH-quinone oxidoreductase subunit C